MINHKRKEYEDLYIYICITESLCYKAEINVILYVNYTSIKKFFLSEILKDVDTEEGRNFSRHSEGTFQDTEGI